MQLTEGTPAGVQLVPFRLFLNLLQALNMLLAFNWLVFCAIGAQRAATGQLFTYPLTLRQIGGARV